MLSDIEWKLRIALNLTYSLREFVDLKSARTSYPNVEAALNDVHKALQQYSSWEQDLLRNLDHVLAQNRWIISTRERDLIELQEQGRILTAGGEILIIKGYPKRNISAVIKEDSYSYFLVAALSCNGKLLYNWKLWNWNTERLSCSINEPHANYYFYYCKITPNSLAKIMRLAEVSRTYENLCPVLRDIWNFTKDSENIFQFQKLPINYNYNEEIKENSEINQNLKREREDDKVEIWKLELKIKELTNSYIINEQELKKKCSLLEKEKEDLIQQYNKKYSDFENEINSLKAENYALKNTVSEKETLINMSWEQSWNSRRENEIIKLSMYRKHGLPNFGNTCYLNSLLQILASTPLFISKIENIDSQFCNSLLLLLRNMCSDNSSKTISNLTRNFYDKLMEAYSNIGLHTQQDTKEVLNMIISKVEEDGGNIDIFSTVFHQSFTCNRFSLYPKHQSMHDDIQTFLIIPPNSKDSPEIYLKNLTRYSTSRQPLFCNGCNSIVDINIKLDRVDWPDYLILYFPTPPNCIKESFYISSKINYEMYGAICYYQDQGVLHYTACTKDGNEWNEYNDEYVEKKSIDLRVINLAFYSKTKNYMVFNL